MEWRYTYEEKVARKTRFPSTEGLHCSQCERAFEAVEFGGSYLDVPVCVDCGECLNVINKVLGSFEDDDCQFKKIKPAFTRKEARAVFDQAHERATKWAEENPEYIKAATLLKPYFWAKRTYDLPDQPEKK